MSSTFSISAKLFIGAGNGSFQTRISAVITRREDAITAPRRRSNRKICAEYAKTFYLGTRLMTEERQKAIWAIYVWRGRTDELVDGPNATYMGTSALDRWEERIHDIFNGRPYDMLDAALTDAVFSSPCISSLSGT
ncbi:hypothetical protein SLA2020_460450 [Shorea laevis]